MRYGHYYTTPPQGAVERAATMLQPEQDASGQSRKTTAQKTAETAYLCGVSRQSSTYPESVDLTYKEEVAGSNPASPTLEKWYLRENVEDGRGSAEVLASSTPTQEFSSTKALNDVAFSYRQR